ncbi:hypothetical protein [Rhodococcus sp. W8901]|uniref:hypothetical protein n=1 Tax=Rhodococcus sp. W8901 TaxID=2742603 RepID=UPI0015837069|nr:hypothetical protein [Rhodococcus sp. W8901]QKT12148.1 hypothetical protein HUN07_16825 [Rhodococcus sp. W8901]
MVVAGCGTSAPPETPDTSTAVGAGSESGTWLRLAGAWPEQVDLPAPRNPECWRLPHTGDSREYTAKTSDFADYDSGGENPGRDFDLDVTAFDRETYPDGTPSPPFARIRFSNPDGRHYTLIGVHGKNATIAASDTDPTVTFEVTGKATSIDGDPILVRASGRIQCETFIETL